MGATGVSGAFVTGAAGFCVPFKEISFSDLNGQSVLLLSRIGFWNEVCQRMIPESHLLFQDDPSVFNELTKMSALPNFKMEDPI